MARSSDTDSDVYLILFLGLMLVIFLAVVTSNSVLEPIFGDKEAKEIWVVAIMLMSAIAIVWWLGWNLLKLWENAARESREAAVEQAAREQRQAEWRREKEQKQVEQAAREAELRRQKKQEALEQERRLISFGFGNVGTLSGPEFELAIALLLRKVGFEKVETTTASGDFGADLLISHGGNKIVVQCKRWSATVGLKAVQEVHSAKSHYRANEAWVITSSTFTQPAKKLAKTTKVRLFDWQDVRADRIRPD